MKVLKLSKWAKDNGYSYRGAYNRFLRGELDGAYKNETGRIFVELKEPESIITVVYARVSSFNYIETLLNGEIVIANRADSDRDDLMQDMISVITSMVARYYGQRRGSSKTKAIIEHLK